MQKVLSLSQRHSSHWTLCRFAWLFSRTEIASLVGCWRSLSCVLTNVTSSIPRATNADMTLSVMQMASVDVFAEGHLQCFTLSQFLQFEATTTKTFLNSPVSEVTQPNHTCRYCCNVHHVEEKNEWPPVTLPLQRRGTSKMMLSTPPLWAL